MQVFFADGVTNVFLSSNGLVRLEFGRLDTAAAVDGEQKGVLTATQQVVMPMDGFLRAFGSQEQVVKKLIDDGVVKRYEPGLDEDKAS